MTFDTVAYKDFAQKHTAYWEGYFGQSVLDNPYWKDYPDNPGSADSIKARRWVDGYCSHE